MDQIDLDLARRAAGSAYLSAVRKLGLEPDALFWSFDRVENRFVLMLVTELVDFKGPLRVADVLFQAYNAAATPREIDPFVVRLHSPKQTFVQRLGGERMDASAEVADVEIGDVLVRAAWVYHFALPPARTSTDLSRRWTRFAQTVEQLAA